MNKVFSFGLNWQRYFKLYVDESAIQRAKESLLIYLEPSEYKNKVFVDIGCGSGIFSLAALMLDCKKVISFDKDLKSIETTRSIQQKFDYLIENENHWEIAQGDILDDNYTRQLDNLGDIVYSWGVLHHTGSMWKAIENAAKIVKNNGYFIIALYNHAPSSMFWLKIKKKYNNHGYFVRFFLITVLLLERFLGRFLLDKNPFRNKRGMSVFIDVVDWLGGYPYEFVCADKVVDFVKQLGFDLISTPTKLPCGENMKSSCLDKIRSRNTGCNEFVFRRNY